MELAEHQQQAVDWLLHRLERHRGVVLADDVGLGKSFVAAEIIRRLRLPTDLIVPASLQEQWRATLEAFGVEARLLTFDRLTRLSFVPSGIDRLVVVDEAHAFRNPATKRHAALARLTVGARVLLVTATPLCNSVRDLETLLRIVARDDVLAGIGLPSIDAAFGSRKPEEIRRVLDELLLRRERAVLPESLRFGELERQVIVHPVMPARTIDRLTFPLVGETALLRGFLQRRLESSEAALAESVRRQLRFYERALSSLAAGRVLPKRAYRQAFGHEEDRQAFQEVLFWDLFAPAGAFDGSALRSEMRILDALLREAEASPCPKRTLLIDLIRSSAEPVLIFTSAAATAQDLQEALRPHARCGLVSARVPESRSVIDAFRRGRLDVLISTDCSSEGLNLQRAGMVVHYDIPWNPVKLDQRNGRAFRIGQPRASVRAVYFIPRGRRTNVVPTVARKNRIRRRLLSEHAATPLPPVRTLRPRLDGMSAWIGLEAAASTRGLRLPELLARRHKAGIEELMRTMSREFLDGTRLSELIRMVERELNREPGNL